MYGLDLLVQESKGPFKLTDPALEIANLSFDIHGHSVSLAQRARARRQGLIIGTKRKQGLGPARLLLQPHAWPVAVGELDARFFERTLNGFDGARLQRFAGFEAHDRAGRDMGQPRQLAHTQFQGGSRHAALSSVH